MTDPIRDPERDPALGEALRRAGGEPPFDEVDWAGLRGRIAAGAELPLARLRREAVAGPSPSRARSARTGGWRRVVPAAAAAGIGAIALAGTLRFLPMGAAESSPGSLPPQEAVLVEEIVSASLPDGLSALLSGEAAADALMEAAVGS